MIILEEDNLDELIKNGIFMVVFYTEWCSSCSFMKPIIDSLTPLVKIIKVDADKFNNLTLKYGLKSLPSLFLIKDGNIIKEFPGYHKRELFVEEINKLKAVN